MSHSFDTKAEARQQTGATVILAITLGGSATLLTAQIFTTGSPRTGADPTYNSVPMVQAGTTQDSGEVVEELWYLLAPPTGSSYDFSCGNTGIDEVSVVLSSFIASGGVSSFDKAGQATGSSSTPTISITPTNGNAVIVDALGTGDRDEPTANTQTLLYKWDTGSEGYASQYALVSGTTLTVMGYTTRSDDWGIIAAVFDETEVVLDPISGSLDITLESIGLSAQGGVPQDEVFADGFEDGTDDAWTSQVGTPTVTAGAALAGTSYGLAIAVSTTEDYEIKTLVPVLSTGVIRTRFYMDPNGNTAIDSSLWLMRVLGSANDIFSVKMDYSSGFRIHGVITNDAPTGIDTADYSITDEEHYIEVLCKRATSAVASDGSLQLWIDGVSKEIVSGIDNYNQWDADVDTIRFGNAYYPGTNDADIYVDELVVRADDTEIGAVSGGIEGDASIVMDDISLSAAGSVDIQGGFNVTLEAIDLNGIGTAQVQGDLNITLDSVELTADGGGALVISGNLDATLEDIGISGVGSVQIQGSLSETLEGIGLSAAGTQLNEGVLDETLDNVAIVSSGSVDVQGTLDAALDSIEISAVGAVDITGALTNALDSIGFEGVGAVDISGALSVTFDTISLDGQGGGSPVIAGDLDITLDTIVLNGAGSVNVVGDLDATLGAIVLTGVGTVQVQGGLDETLSDISLLADGAVTIAGALASRLEDLVLVGQGEVTVQGSLSEAFDDVGIVANGSVQIQSALSVVLDTIELDGQGGGESVISGDLNITLDDIGISASATSFTVFFGEVALSNYITDDVILSDSIAKEDVELSASVIDDVYILGILE